MKNKRKFIILGILVIVAMPIIVFVLQNGNNIDNQDNCTAKIVSYTKNRSYIEYPQIDGLEDTKKQEDINKILKNQVVYGAKNYEGETFVDFSNHNYYYIFETGIGLLNKKIASFIYTFDGYGEVELEDGIMRNTYRNYGVTIDMRTGKKIELSDFMEIDERLINSSDGNPIEPDYGRERIPEFHKFKDAFEIYDSKEEEDIYHKWSVEEAIKNLKDYNETNWYIDEDKNIVFYYIKNCVKIPYENISDAIYPEYRKALDE